MRSGSGRLALLRGLRAARRRVLPRIHPKLVGRRQSDSRAVRSAHPEGGRSDPEGRRHGFQRAGGPMMPRQVTRVLVENAAQREPLHRRRARGFRGDRAFRGGGRALVFRSSGCRVAGRCPRLDRAPSPRHSRLPWPSGVERVPIGGPGGRQHHRNAPIFSSLVGTSHYTPPVPGAWLTRQGLSPSIGIDIRLQANRPGQPWEGGR
jgi:hypothetical protein